jgi:NADH-quinone oxidoreductase subunit I
MSFLERISRTFFLTDIQKGLKTTLRHLFKRPITVQYPKERLEALPRFRGSFRLLLDEEGVEICNGCNVCALVCPVDCIEVVREGKGKDSIASVFEINITHCMYCDLCVEACPRACIVMTDFYEEAEYHPDVILDRDALYQGKTPRVFKK